MFFFVIAFYDEVTLAQNSKNPACLGKVVVYGGEAGVHGGIPNSGGGIFFKFFSIIDLNHKSYLSSVHENIIENLF